MTIFLSMLAGAALLLGSLASVAVFRRKKRTGPNSIEPIHETIVAVIENAKEKRYVK